MSEKRADYEQAITLAMRLSAIEKVRLVEEIMVTLEKDLAADSSRRSKPAERSLYGIWADVNITPEDIDQARRELWSGFPREDIG